MAAGDRGFCDNSNYAAAGNIDQLIATDTGAFFRAYRNWEATDPLPTSPAEMLLFFSVADATAALDKGDGAAGRTAGEVRAGHCSHFNEFVAHYRGAAFSYSDAELNSVGLAANTYANVEDTIFEVAIRKFLQGDALTDLERAFLNGALFVQVDVRPSSIGSGQPEERLFAVPGFELLRKWDRPLSNPFWIGMNTLISQALRHSGSQVLNVHGVVQLRLGTTGGLFDAIKVAPGFVIKGGM